MHITRLLDYLKIEPHFLPEKAVLDKNSSPEKSSPQNIAKISPPDQSVMYVPLQVNRFAESVLLIVQYRYLKSYSGYLKSYSGDFYSP